MARLPARSLSDAPLADAMDQPGCPVCRRVAAAADRFLGAVLYERVNDVAFRRQLDAARGFCPTHIRATLEANRRGTGGTLSSAILFRAILAIRRREIEAVIAAGDRGRGRDRRWAEASRPPDCLPCEQRREAEADAIAALVRLAADTAWADALAVAPLCLEHLLALLGAPRRPAGFARVEAGQAERLAALEATLAAVAHHSAEDRTDLLTPEEHASADEGASLLGGGIG